MDTSQLINLHVRSGELDEGALDIPNTGVFGGVIDFLSTNRLALIISLVFAIVGVFIIIKLFAFFSKKRLSYSSNCPPSATSATKTFFTLLFSVALAVSVVPFIASAANLIINARDDVIDVTIDKSLTLSASAPFAIMLKNDLVRSHYVTAQLITPTSPEVGSQITASLININGGNSQINLTPISQSIYANHNGSITSNLINLDFSIKLDIVSNLPAGDYVVKIFYQAFYEDNVPPTIVINGADVIYHEVGTPYRDLGANAIDDLDGIVDVVVLSSNLDVNQLGTYTIVYYATDVAGNSATKERTVIVRDTIPPVITVDPTTVYIMQHDEIDLMDGVSAVDNYDGDLTSSVTYKSSPDFDHTTIGAYSITYDVQDSSGNRATSQTRIINVTDGTAPEGEARYSTNEPTNQDVTVRIITNKPIDTPDGWTKIDDITYEKIYTDNTDGTEQVKICLEGSSGDDRRCSYVDVTVDNIDKTPPELDLSYTPPGPTETNLDVVATVVSNEPLGPLPSGWVGIGDNTYQKTYPANTIEEVTFHDLAGNPVTVDIEITWINKAPRITSINPNKGPTAGGTVVTINGTNFTTAITVTLDGSSCEVRSVTATTITCVTPAHAAGAVDVKVSTIHGNDTLSNGFTYIAPPEIDSVIPNPEDEDDKTVQGGGTITIIGDNLDPIDVIYVDMDGDETRDDGEICANVIITPDTPSSGKYTVTCILPEGNDGEYYIIIETIGGSDKAPIKYGDDGDGDGDGDDDGDDDGPSVTKILPDNSRMQDISPAKCTAATLFDGTNTEAISFVKDSRDNRYYAIAKMPDNRCWMITNLAYAQGNHYTGAGAWSSTTTVPYYTDPHADSTVHDGGVSGDGVACPSPSYRMSANQINYTECGFLYNWPAVTAATICPTGWSLPTGSNGQANTTNNDFHALYQSLGTSKTGRFTALVGTGSLWKGVYSGYFNTVDALFSLGIIQVGQGAAYWSSTAATELGDGFRRTFGYSTSGVGLNNDVAGTSASRSASGNAIRCVANK